MDNVRFAQTIKNSRLKKGYTQSQLADLLNVSNKQGEAIQILPYLLK